MFLWHRYPYVRIIIFYLLGILLGFQCSGKIENPLLILVGVFIFSSLSLTAARFFVFKHRYFTGLLLGFSISIIGLLITNHHRFEGREKIISPAKKNYLFQITEEPKETEKSVKVIGKVHSYSQADPRLHSTKLLIYFAKDSTAKTLKYGDQLKIHLGLNEIQSPQNPHEFNYKKYLANHKIYYQAYAPSRSWSIVGRPENKSLKYLAISIRQHLLKSLQNSSLSQPEYAVAAAILLGQDELLDDATRQDYAGAGAMHVLCVSGLHVGIIYLAFNLLLGFLDKKKHQLILKTFLLLTIVWTYALITGFSPSVMRASVMLSFIIIGKASNKKGNIYNSIAASAFLLLLINPLMIMEVGFQLSYAAVIGIVSIYPLLKKRIKHSNKIIDKTFSILIISLAAQIGTFPLAIYYFHQFPVYFLITNLMIVTLASIIINLGLLFLICSTIPIVSQVLQFAFKHLIHFMNWYVGFIESLPGSTAKALILNFAEVVLIYFLIIALAQAIIRKTKISFSLFLVLALALTASFSSRHFKQISQKKFIVYKISGHSIFEFQTGKHDLMFSDSSLISNSQKLNYHVFGNLWHSGIKNPIQHSLTDSGNQNKKSRGLYFFGGKSFLRISNQNGHLIKHLQLSVDYIILSNNINYSILKIQQQFNPSLIIFDSSNSFYYEQRVAKEIQEKEISTYSVNQQGAFILRF